MDESYSLICDICNKKILGGHIVVKCRNVFSSEVSDKDICSKCFKKIPYPLQFQLYKDGSDIDFNHRIIEAIKSNRSSESLRHNYVVMYKNPPEITKYFNKKKLAKAIIYARNSDNEIEMIILDDKELKKQVWEKIVRNYIINAKNDELIIG